MMSVLQVLSEEVIPDDSLEGYLEDLYKIVCVGERPSRHDNPSSLVRTTYVVDWEQLVHLLEDYTYFGEDIVQVARVSADEAKVLRVAVQEPELVARA